MFLLLLQGFFTSSEMYAQKKNETEVHTSLYYIQRADDLENAGSWEAAKKEIDEGLKHYPDNPELLYLNGKYYYYAQRDLQKSRYNLVKALQNNEQHWGSRRLLVDVEEESGHFSSSICYINELLEEQPYDKGLWMRKISLYEKGGNKTEAEAALERLSRIYPNDTIIRRNLSMLHRETWNRRLNASTLAEQAAKLESYINNDPDIYDYYLELSDIYLKMGDYDKASSTAKRGLVVFPKDAKLIKRVASLMSEQGLYTRALTFLKENRIGGATYDNAMREAANDARLRDAYEIHGRLYDRTGDTDALTYLLNTSLTRGYYDDALRYLQEAYKLEGRTTRLLLKEYDLQKRMGNKGKSEALLKELYQKNPDDEELRQEYVAMLIQLANIDEEQDDSEGAYQRITDASEIMEKGTQQWVSVMSRRITLLGKMNRDLEARRLFGEASIIAPAYKDRFTDAYVMPILAQIKDLIEEEHYEHALKLAEEILGAVYNSEAALRVCINMTQTLGRKEQFYKYAQQGFDYYPEVPYFRIKQALALQQQDRYAEALQILNPRQPGEVYPVQQLINPFAGVSQDFATMLIQDNMPDLAIHYIDNALEYDPDNKDLKYLKGLAFEKMHDFGKAYEYESKYYNPSNAEQGEWLEHIRYLRFRSFSNRVDASYSAAFHDTQEGNLSSVGHMYSLASLSYSHLWEKHTLTLQLNYKASNGYYSIAAYEPGGMSVEGMAQWDMVLSHRWNMMISGSYGTKYFNKYGANIAFGVDLGKGWGLNLKGSYRKTLPVYLYNHRDNEWSSTYKSYNLYMISPRVDKTWGRVNLAANVDLISLGLKNNYYNATLKGKVFVNNDNISSVGALIGVGSFPELTFFDQATMNGISNMNATLGLEGIYLLTKNLFISLNGTWNTYYNPIFDESGEAVESYKNVYMINLGLHIAF